MRVPEILKSLTDQGVIDEVIRPLKSGKEAEVYLVDSQGEIRVAKVYKSIHRSFKNRAEYTEGRVVRGSRDQRAIERRTRHGKAQEEEAWKSAEVDIIHRLHAAGVRVPTPYHFIDGVLIMELVRDEDGLPAPRLGEVALHADTARTYFDQLLREVVKMLCAGVVHGDLSDYNILVDAQGPVIIDFPQAVDAAANRNAKKLLVRDVDNLSAFLGRSIPGTRRRPYGEEIWTAFESNALTPDYVLSGTVRRSKTKTDIGDVLGLIDEADADEQQRRGEPVARPRRREVVITAPAAKSGQKRQSQGRGGSRSGGGTRDGQKPRRDDRGGRGSATQGGGREGTARAGGEGSDEAPQKRRRRRRRGGSGQGQGQGATRREEPLTFSPRPETSSGEARLPDAGGSRPAASSGPEESGAPKRRRRRRRGGSQGESAPQTSAQPPRPTDASGEDRPPRRRRRRRAKPVS